MLGELFSAYYARDIPPKIYRLDKLHQFDLLSQDKKTINEQYNYPNTFVVGLYNSEKETYDRKHVIDGFIPTDHYKLIKAASDHYTTDSTYLDNIRLTDTIYLENKNAYLLKDTLNRISMSETQATYKMNQKKYVVLIYRKTNPLTRDKAIGEFMIWKSEIVKLQNDTLKTETIEIVNQHLF